MKNIKQLGHTMEQDWRKKASNLLKSELARKGISYDMLREKLAEIGIEETSNSINVKINRGAFSFVFFLQVMKAIDVKVVHF